MHVDYDDPTSYRMDGPNTLTRATCHRCRTHLGWEYVRSFNKISTIRGLICSNKMLLICSGLRASEEHSNPARKIPTEIVSFDVKSCISQCIGFIIKLNFFFLFL